MLCGLSLYTFKHVHISGFVWGLFQFSSNIDVSEAWWGPPRYFKHARPRGMDNSESGGGLSRYVSNTCDTDDWWDLSRLFQAWATYIEAWWRLSRNISNTCISDACGIHFNVLQTRAAKMHGDFSHRIYFKHERHGWSVGSFAYAKHGRPR